ncbi:MAG: HAMP domain-containing protein, partial [Flavobacteriales bacterium]
MRFTIAAKISLGFGLLALAVFTVFLLNKSALQKSRKLHHQITHELMPDVANLYLMQGYVQHVYSSTQSWTVHQRGADDPERIRLTSVCIDSIPALICSIDSTAGSWPEMRSRNWKTIVPDLNNLIKLSNEIRTLLPDFESYSNPTNQINAESMFAEGGEFKTSYNRSLSNLQNLLYECNNELNRDVTSLNTSFDQLEKLMIYVVLFLVFGSLIIGAVTIGSIGQPVRSLRNKLNNLSRGVYSLHRTKTGNDELGDMAQSVDVLINNFERTKEFTLQIGEGN